MVKIEIDVEDFKQKLITALHATGIDCREILQEKAPFATGFLTGHIDYEVVQRGTEIELVFNFPFYAKFLEWGRPPGKMPEVDIIRDWCLVKGIPIEAAYPIAKMIGKIGTRPQPFIRPVINNKLIPILKRNLKQSFI